MNKDEPETALEYLKRVHEGLKRCDAEISGGLSQR